MSPLDKMALAWPAITYLLLIQFALAGPIHRNLDVVRRANAPSKRFIALSTAIPLHLRHVRGTGSPEVPTITSETTSPAPSPVDTENGNVPAIGIDAENASVLASLSSRLAAESLKNAARTSTFPTIAETTSAPPTPASNEDGNEPAIGIEAENSAVIASLNSRLSAESLQNSPRTSTSTTSMTSASALSSYATASPPASIVISTSPTNPEAQAASATETQSKQVGKVPAVGVGAGNTSLLAVLSSSITASLQTSATAAADAAQTTQTTTENAASISTDATSAPCLNVTSTTLSITNIIPASAPITVESQNSVQPTTTFDSSIQAATSTTIIPIPGSESPNISSASNPIPVSTIEPIAGAAQDQPTTIPDPAPSPSISAGQTVTLRISTTMTTTMPFSTPTESSATASLGTSDTAAISLATTTTTTVQSVPEPVAVSEAPASLSLPESLASTTVTPIVSQQNLVTASTSNNFIPAPSVTIQIPSASSDTTISVLSPSATADSPSVTIPFDGFSIVLKSGPAPTAAGNTVVPIMGPFLTVTVTTTVTAQ